jgi:uncharacterized protein (PEP-CTERM system associated)
LLLLAATTALSTSALAQIAAPGPTPPFLFRAGGSLDVTYTDNVDPNLPVKDEDLLVSSTATANLLGRGARGEVNANLNLSYDYYTQNTRLNGARYSGFLGARTDVYEDYFDIALRGDAGLQQTNSQGGEAATDRLLGSNQTQVLSGSVTPRLRSQFGDVARATLTYDLSGTFYTQPATSLGGSPASDAVIQNAALDVASGPDFDRLRWNLRGYIEREKKVGTLASPAVFPNREVERQNGEVELRYATTGSLELVGTGGYDNIDQATLTTKVDGAYGTAGFSWRPSPRTDVNVQAGYRYSGPTAQAEITYAPRPSFRIGLALEESIETQQRLATRRSGDFITDETGLILDPVTGSPPDVNGNDFDINDAPFRRNSVRLSIGGNFRRTGYSLSGSYEKRDRDLADSESWTTTAQLSRELGPRGTFVVSGSYQRTQEAVATARNTEEYSASARYDYQLGPTFYSSLVYYYRDQTTALISSQENAVVLSLSRRF